MYLHTMQTNEVNLFWFRRDLRLEDNAGLYHALTSNLPVLPLFIFDPDILDRLSSRQDLRVQFIHEQLQRLKQELNEAGSDLLVFYGRPLDVFKNLITQYRVKKVLLNRDYEPFTKKRDSSVKSFCEENGIEYQPFKDHVIFERLEIAKEDGNPYKVYTPYQKRWKEEIKQVGINSLHSERHVNNFIKISPVSFPALEALGFKERNFGFPTVQFDTGTLKNYSEYRDFPYKDGTSKLGIHLRHGTISIRKAVREAQKSSETWLNQLIWREFYIMILDNYPFVVDTEFNRKYAAIPWKYDEDNFQKWCDGQTGYPIVDAGMRELNETGYMHNRVRMITASFLTKHLLIDWRWGEAYFAEKLLDYELANNNGGWQWAAGCGTDAQPYFRIFNPYEQAKKFDPKMKYIKRWVLELNSKNYPQPIIDHKFARERAIKTFTESLQ